MRGVIVLAPGVPVVCLEGEAAAPSPAAPAAAVVFEAPAPAAEPPTRPRRRKNKILPLLQYRRRRNPPKIIVKRQRPRASRSWNDVLSADGARSDWSSRDMARSFSEMLRGEHDVETKEVRVFSDEFRSPAWDPRDEQVALRLRSAAYAEAAAVRAADEAVEAEQRLIDAKKAQSLPVIDERPPATSSVSQRAAEQQQPLMNLRDEPVRIKSSRASSSSRRDEPRASLPATRESSSSPQPKGSRISYLRQQRERRRRRDAETDEFIATMAMVVRDESRGTIEQDRTASLIGHAKLIEQYAASLMPPPKHAYQNEGARPAKVRNRNPPRQPTRLYDETWLRTYFGDLTHGSPKCDALANSEEAENERPEAMAMPNELPASVTVAVDEAPAPEERYVPHNKAATANDRPREASYDTLNRAGEEDAPHQARDDEYGDDFD